MSVVASEMVCFYGVANYLVTVVKLEKFCGC